MISTTRWCRLPSLQLGAGPEQATSLSGPEQAILQCCWDPLRRAVAFVADTANVGGHDVKRKDGVLSFAFMCTSELGVTCIYLLELRGNVDLPQVKIEPFCLILVDAHLKFYLHRCCVFNIDKSFSEIVDSESSGCCMVLLKCISFRDILLFWILGTVGIQIYIFL